MKGWRISWLFILYIPAFGVFVVSVLLDEGGVRPVKLQDCSLMWFKSQLTWRSPAPQAFCWLVSIRPGVDVAGVPLPCHWSIFIRLHGPLLAVARWPLDWLCSCTLIYLWHLGDICHPVLLCFSRKDFVNVVFWEHRHRGGGHCDFSSPGSVERSEGKFLFDLMVPPPLCSWSNGGRVPRFLWSSPLKDVLPVASEAVGSHVCLFAFPKPATRGRLRGPLVLTLGWLCHPITRRSLWCGVQAPLGAFRLLTKACSIQWLHEPIRLWYEQNWI